MGAAADLSIRDESLVSAVANVALTITHLATLAILARALRPTDLGLYFFALSAAMIAIVPSRELSKIMRKRVSEPGTDSGAFFGLAQYGTLGFLAVFGAALIPAGPVLTANTPLTASVLVAFFAYTAVLTQSAMCTRLYDAVGKPGASMLSQAVREAVFLAGVAGLLWAGTATAELVLFVRAGVHLVAAVATYAVVGLLPAVPSRAVLASAFDFGKWNASNGVASQVWSEAPTLLLGMVVGGAAVAVYESAKRVTMAGAYLATCINDPILVKLSALGPDDDAVTRYLELAVGYTPAVAIPGLFLIAPIADRVFVVLAGSEYAGAGLVLVGVAAMHVLSGLKTPITAAAVGVGRPRFVFGLTLLTLGVGLPAIYLGTVSAGVEGAVLALVVVDALTMVAAFWVARRLFGEWIRPSLLHQQVAAGLVAGLVVWALSTVVVIGGLRDLLLVLGLGATVHFALFARLSREFREGARDTLVDVRQVVQMKVRPYAERRQ